MDEEITIIDNNTRNEKIKKFFIKNKNRLIVIIITIIILILGYLSFVEIKKSQMIELANKYNAAVIDINKGEKKKTTKELMRIIEKKDPTYSPLALYFLIDNNLIKEKIKINSLFDILINETSLQTEIKNLIIYKKALYNSGTLSENELIKILKPITSSESIWKSHALYLIGEYFYSNNEMQKAKEFFNEIINLQNSNINIKLESQKRLNRDFSE